MLFRSRTIFNILGPLTNPAGAPTQVLGVFHPDLVGIQVRVLQRLGSRHAITVHGRDGLDEISISGPTLIGELKAGQVTEYSIEPGQFGLSVHPLESLKAADVQASRAMVMAALENRPGAPRDIVALNAGAAIYVAGKASSMAGGVDLALDVMRSGAPLRKLEQLVSLTQSLAAGKA